MSEQMEKLMEEIATKMAERLIAHILKAVVDGILLPKGVGRLTTELLGLSGLFRGSKGEVVHIQEGDMLIIVRALRPEED